MFSWNDICFKEDSIISSFHKFVSWIVPHHMVVQRCLSVLILWPGSESRALVITSLEERCLGWKQLYRSCGVIFGICWKLWADHEENSHDPSTVFPFYLGANHHPLFWSTTLQRILVITGDWNMWSKRFSSRDLWPSSAAAQSRELERDQWRSYSSCEGLHSLQFCSHRCLGWTKPFASICYF